MSTPSIVRGGGEEDVAGARRIDFAKLAPEDVRFYVELNDLAAMQRRLDALDIWTSVRELTEQAGAASQPFRTRARLLLGMPPERVIQHLLGHRSALFATTSAEWEKGVIVAELPDEASIDRLLKRWNPQDLGRQGAVRQYRLSSGLLLGVWNRLIVLGPKDDPAGLWARTLLVISGKAVSALADRSEFAGMRARLRLPYDGIAYASWAAVDPFALADCERIIVAFSLTETELRCEVYGQRRLAVQESIGVDLEAARGLPADSLAVWAGSFDAEHLRRPSSGSILGDDRSLVGLLAGTISAVTLGQDGAAGGLGPRAVVVVGDTPEKSGDGVRVPPVTVVCEAAEADRYSKNIGDVVELLAVATGAMRSAEVSDAPIEHIETRRCEGVDVHFVRFGLHLSRRFELDFLEQVQLCWAADGDRLLLSSSADHVEAILKSTRGKSPRLEGDRVGEAVMREVSGGAPVTQLALLRGRQLSKVLREWLIQLRRVRPDGVRDEIWRAWAKERLARSDRFGLGLRDDENRAARSIVVEVEAESPAAGHLRPGDVIVEAAGRRLPAAEPSLEVAQRFRERGTRREFKLRIEREGRALDVAVPVAPARELDLGKIRPVQTILQWAMLLRPIESLAYVQRGGAPGRIDAEILVRWSGVSDGRAPGREGRR